MNEKVENTTKEPTPEQLADILSATLAIMKESQGSTSRVNWQYVFSHKKPCALLAHYIREGRSLYWIGTILTGTEGKALSFARAIKNDADRRVEAARRKAEVDGVQDAIIDDSIAAYIEQLSYEAGRWDEETQITEDYAKLVHVMQMRVARCADYSGKILWDSFFANAENRAFVLELIQASRVSPPGRINSIDDLTRFLIDQEGKALTAFVRALPNTIAGDPLASLEAYLQNWKKV